MIQAAHEVYLLVDHTKMGTESLVKVAPLESIHHLITGASLSPQDRLALTQRGLDLIIAQETNN